MAENVNRVVITGNLTRDPEYKEPREGVQVTNLRVAVNEREKQGDTWGERANYFDVTCFGALAKNVSQYLKKGSGLAIDGRLRWREWTNDAGDKRQGVSIIASAVQFLDGGSKGGSDGQGAPQADVPADTSDFATAPSAADDDIPF